MDSVRAVTSNDDVLDVRDIIDRVEHLEPLRKSGPVDLGPEDNEAAQDDLFAELADLEALLKDFEGSGWDEQWRGRWYPVTLVRDSYFETYAQELAEELGLTATDGRWPTSFIDWPKAAEALKEDYTPGLLDGVTYWGRA